MPPQVIPLHQKHDDDGNMSLDFLVGFTIFLMAFIWVATMIPGILIGLQAHTIDYDAVAYRTGVLLVEDPGWPATPGWETESDERKADMIRFGLAISKETPNMLADSKVTRFFNTTTFIYPEDYRDRLIFGDFPYRFNISLRDIEKDTILVVGDALPDGYGHIRRLVKIKSTSNTTIGSQQIAEHRYTNTENVTRHEFSILFNNTKLLNEQKDPLYQIDLSSDPVMVNITDFRETLFYNPNPVIPPDYHIPPDQVRITLVQIDVYKEDAGILTKMGTFDDPIFDDDNTPTQLPHEVKDAVSLKITPDYIVGMQAQYTKLYFNLSFYLTQDDLPVGNPPVCSDPCKVYPSTFLNNTNARAPPFDYNYHPANVTQPRLRDGIVEVSVW